MSTYLIVPLLWSLLIISEIAPLIAYASAIVIIVLSALFWIVPVWVATVFYGLFILLWRLYRWRVNTTHSLFMIAYVSLFTGVWLVYEESSPRVMWIVWFLCVSGIALAIASRVARRYNGKIEAR